MKEIFVDDSDHPISPKLKAKIAKLARFFYHRRYEYSIIVYGNGKTTIHTSSSKSSCAYQPFGKPVIWLHNHPNSIAYPSLMDRLIARDAEISGVYGRNYRLNRLEVYIY